MNTRCSESSCEPLCIVLFGRQELGYWLLCATLFLENGATFTVVIRLFVNGKFTENFHILVLHLPHFFWCVLVCLTRAFIMFACWLGHCQGCTTHLGVPYLWLFFTFEPNLSGEGREGGGCERSVLSCGNYSYVTSVI